MSLRTKTYLITGGMVAGMIAIVAIFTQTILLKSVAKVEEEAAQRSIRRVLNALADDLSVLNMTAADWAVWDDTYQFAQDLNEDYIDANLDDNTLLTLRLNVMLFAQRSGVVVFGKAINLATSGTQPLPASLLERVVNGELLMSQLDDRVSGIIMLDSGPALVVAHPILKSEGTGPVMGTLIFARYLTGQQVRRLGQVTELTVSGYNWDMTSASPDVRRARERLEQGGETVVRALSPDTIAGYALVNDISGQPALVLKAEMPRDIFMPARDSIIFFFFALTVAGSFYGFIVLVLLRIVGNSRKRLEIILNNSPDATVLARGDGRIEHANPAFNRLFDRGAKNGAALYLSDLVADAQRSTVQAAFEALAAEQQPKRFQAALMDRHGQPFHADVALAPIPGVSNRSSGVVCSLRDISSLKQVENQLRQTLEREMELNQLRSRIVTVTSHELRTPLAVIRLASDILFRYGEQLSPDKRAAQLTQIQDGVARMTDLIEDVSVFNHLDSGQIKYRFRTLDLARLCEEVVDQIRMTSPTHTFEFLVSGTRRDVHVDKKLMRYIISNLVTNAVAYSPLRSRVEVSVDYQPAHVVLRVRDHGAGIPPEEQPRVFEPFFRGTNTDAVVGTGLGLPIARQAVELHAGTITFESVLHTGTTFTVTLPYQDNRGEA